MENAQPKVSLLCENLVKSSSPRKIAAVNSGKRFLSVVVTPLFQVVLCVSKCTETQGSGHGLEV